MNIWLQVEPGHKCLVMEVAGGILKRTGLNSAHIQPNDAELVGQHFTVQMYDDPLKLKVCTSVIC